MQGLHLTVRDVPATVYALLDVQSQRGGVER